MKNKAYSGLDLIPCGHVSEKITKGCLVLEGGAFRSLYSQGAQDVLMQQDMNFEAVIGVSAGALSGMNYCSGTIGRSARANLGYRHDPSYVGAKALLESGSIIRLDFLMRDYNLIEPLDGDFFFRPEQRFVAVATNCLTGKTEYFEKGRCEAIFRAVKASASMPFVSKMVMVGNIPCLDGGCSCKIPYQWALDQGYEKIVVIRTRERGFRREVTGKHTAARVYRRHPEFAEALDNSPAAYNAQCDELEALADSGRIFMLSPSRPVTVSRVERSTERLGDLYFEGREDMLRHLGELKEYLES